MDHRVPVSPPTVHRESHDASPRILPESPERPHAFPFLSSSLPEILDALRRYRTRHLRGPSAPRRGRYFREEAAPFRPPRERDQCVPTTPPEISNDSSSDSDSMEGLDILQRHELFRRRLTTSPTPSEAIEDFLRTMESEAQSDESDELSGDDDYPPLGPPLSLLGEDLRMIDGQLRLVDEQHDEPMAVADGAN